MALEGSSAAGFTPPDRSSKKVTQEMETIVEAGQQASFDVSSRDKCRTDKAGGQTQVGHPSLKTLPAFH
jgi:hypothetical protein